MQLDALDDRHPQCEHLDAHDPSLGMRERSVGLGVGGVEGDVKGEDDDQDGSEDDGEETDAQNTGGETSCVYT